MGKKIFIVWSIIYLVAMLILIVGFGAIKNWLDFFSGLVMGVTAFVLIDIFRNRNGSRRNLK